MFVRDAKRLTIPVAPSYLPNNLSSSAHGNLSVVKTNEVHVIKENGEGSKVHGLKGKINQAKYVDILHKSFLAVTSDDGLHVFSEDGASLLFHYPLSSAVPNGAEPRFVRGAEACGKDIVVGCSNGHVLVFDCGELAQGVPGQLQHRLETLEHAILAVAASPSTVAAGDAHGNIFVYNAHEAFAQTAMFRGTGVPVTSLAVVEDVVVAGYSTGHLRIFRTDDVNELAIEIAAHTRAVTALAAQASTQMVASVSADSHVAVWSVPTFRSTASSTLNCVFRDLIENQLSTGVAFVGETKLAVVGYDEEDVVFFSRV